MKIGILALQGAFKEHELMLKKLNVETILIRSKKDLVQLNGIIIPGGESTCMGILLNDLLRSLKELVQNSNVKVWGTCAGLILLADHLDQEKEQQRLGGLPIIVVRNGYGRQMDSFIQKLDLDLGNVVCNGFPGVFIRAPKIILPKDLPKDLKVIARVNGDVVGVIKDNRIIGTSFHPELTNDARFHTFFINLCKDSA